MTKQKDEVAGFAPIGEGALARWRSSLRAACRSLLAGAVCGRGIASPAGAAGAAAGAVGPGPPKLTARAGAGGSPELARIGAPRARCFAMDMEADISGSGSGARCPSDGMLRSDISEIVPIGGKNRDADLHVGALRRRASASAAAAALAASAASAAAAAWAWAAAMSLRVRIDFCLSR